MKSVLNEIADIRSEAAEVIDYTNNNRYRVVFKETDGTKTAYYFTSPVYNEKTRKAVSMEFNKNDSEVHYIGSNAEISFSDKVRMENADGCGIIFFKNPVSYFSSQELHCGNDRLHPTTNGFLYKAHISDDTFFSFDLEVGKSLIQARGNDRYFSLMSENFRPFITISCIGTANKNGEVTAPSEIAYQKLSEYKYRFTVTPCGKECEYVLFEVNLYEPKLFQDTTVESANPTTNNVYGGTAFIGNTAEFGEQWLYTKPDFMQFSDLMDKRINRAILHLPKHSQNDIELSAFKVAARFCSFGSNWENKIAASSAISDSASAPNYYNIDVTSMLTDRKSGRITFTDGMILRTRVKGSGFSAISTADSCFAPQILEIKYK